ALDAALSSPDPKWRDAAAKHSRRFANPLAAIERGVADTNPEVRAAWYRTLMSNQDTGTIPILIRLLSDEAWRHQRVEIVDRLAAFTDPRSLEAIVPLLDDRDLEVRKVALSAVQSIRRALEQRSGVRLLLDALREARKAEERRDANAPWAVEPPAEAPADRDPPATAAPEPEASEGS